jgi:hypothetical protein
MLRRAVSLGLVIAAALALAGRFLASPAGYTARSENPAFLRRVPAR